MKINGKYRYQLYIPSFPSKAFFHTLWKFDPRNDNPGAITVVFSMTKACSYKCPYCYQKSDQGPEVPIEILKSSAKDMLESGTALFDIEGGEPLLKFDRLLNLISALDDRAEIWVNTTGHTLTREKAIKMKEAGVYGVYVSIHYADPKKHEEFTGFPGSFAIACEAVKIFNEVGIVVAINFCPSADSVKGQGVVDLLNLAKDLKASFVQVIHAKSSGGWLYNKDEVYESSELIKKLYNYHFEYNESKLGKDYPSILFQVFEESPDAFGCTAGGIDRYYLNHEGEVQPCEFINVSFGNINEESFSVIFERMRKHFQTPGEKWLCCTESKTIGECIKSNNILKTPVPSKYTCEMVKKWDKGTPTKLYRDLKMYNGSK